MHIRTCWRAALARCFGVDQMDHAGRIGDPKPVKSRRKRLYLVTPWRTGRAEDGICRGRIGGFDLQLDLGRTVPGTAFDGQADRSDIEHRSVRAALHDRDRKRLAIKPNRCFIDAS